MFFFHAFRICSVKFIYSFILLEFILSFSILSFIDSFNFDSKWHYYSFIYTFSRFPLHPDVDQGLKGLDRGATQRIPRLLQPLRQVPQEITRCQRVPKLPHLHRLQHPRHHAGEHWLPFSVSRTTLHETTFRNKS